MGEAAATQGSLLRGPGATRGRDHRYGGYEFISEPDVIEFEFRQRGTRRTRKEIA
jgi:hypothetical protein